MHKAALEALNEIQHQLSAHFRKLLGDSKAGFPDEAVIDVLFGWPMMPSMARADFSWAFEISARHYHGGKEAAGKRAASPSGA